MISNNRKNETSSIRFPDVSSRREGIVPIAVTSTATGAVVTTFAASCHLPSKRMLSLFGKRLQVIKLRLLSEM